MEFVGRERELDALEREYAQPRSSMTVLYGRRRLGKTTLCTRFARGKRALYFLATEESEAQNRAAFQNMAADFLDDSLLASARIDDWTLIFRRIAETSGEGKPVIILDEFQHLGMANPAFPSIFQRIWDIILKDANVMVVLCGSLVSMMESQTLSYSSPLYGRRTSQIHLKQMPFSTYGGLFPGLEESTLISLYALTGGVPAYAAAFREGENLEEAIRANILDPASFLYSEPYFLLRQEVESVGTYFSLLRAIAAGNARLGAVASVLQTKQTSLTRYLRVLIDLDILRREVPATEENPEKSKKGIYVINDNFLRFWFRFVHPYTSYLEAGHPEPALRTIRRDLKAGHVAHAYEELCRQRVWDMSAEGCWEGTFDRVGRYWDSKDTEIDIAALDADRSILLLGECKYTGHPVGTDVLHALQHKAKQVPWRKNDRSEHYVLFSAGGFTDALKEEAAADKRILLDSFGS